MEIFDKNFSDFAFRVFEKEPEGSWERETAVSNQATLLQVSLSFSNSSTFLFLFYSFLNTALSESDLAICFTFLFYFSFFISLSTFPFSQSKRLLQVKLFNLIIIGVSDCCRTLTFPEPCVAKIKLSTMPLLSILKLPSSFYLSRENF